MLQRRSNRATKPTAKQLALKAAAELVEVAEAPKVEPQAQIQLSKWIEDDDGPELIVEGGEEDACDQESASNLSARKSTNEARMKKDRARQKKEELQELRKLDLETLMKKFPDLKDVKFEPFERGEKRLPQVQIPPEIDSESPYQLFSLFFPDSTYEMIAKHTNQYATIQMAGKDGYKARKWYATNSSEIKTFIGILIYMGIHHSPRYPQYWNTSQSDGPIHTVRLYMSQDRFLQIHRFFHISRPEPPPAMGPIFNDTQELEELEEDYTPYNEQIWWSKVEPLASQFRNACARYYIPGSGVAIDEIMIRFFGRSQHTVKMPNKPIKEGYKLYGLAERGYVWWFVWSSKRWGITEFKKHDNLCKTGSMVFEMVKMLPIFEASPYTVYLDNFFTSIPLFRKMREQGVGACGTARPNGEEFPAILKVIKDTFAKVRFLISFRYFKY